MNFIQFYRESNKFDDIIKDPALKNKYKTKIQYNNNLLLGFPEEADDSSKILSYILLKYGDEIIEFNKLVPDRSPIMGVDYVPKRK